MMPEIGLLILRVMVGVVFMAHGAQKLFGWFGGPGLTKYANGMEERSRIYPGWFWAWVNALTEFVGGLFMVFGFLTPVAAAMLICVMIVAIIKVHWAKGFFATNGGYEFNLTLIAALLTIALSGPGAYAWNPDFFADWSPMTVFTVSLVIGLIGVLFALLSGGLHVPTPTQRPHPR
jgi:putative oxidoreductase